MAQFNITITEELLHGLFLSNGRDEAFLKLLEKSSTRYYWPNLQSSWVLNPMKGQKEEPPIVMVPEKGS